MKSPLKSLVLIASLGLVLGACTIRSETVVEKPMPVAATSSTTTYTSPDPASPTGTSTTTIYRN